ncbi:class I SAM-dependent methyltransferase [Mangrovimonas futianensis]|uniref:class I SAM-dependent methyltransferase n=2 Tax=Mangrovimonas futianensis TaxID=2895523 RepID=UPI001E653A6B|nr:class I SAM-dependent methyltransferase [Mangrovimonas futianensis]
MSNRPKQPWPTKAAMEQIYDQHLWGGHPHDFYSGEGSHDPKIVEPYVDSVSAFLKNFDSSLIVCDLGCGDFNIGRQLAPFTQKYIGIDIVASLIERNKTLFTEKDLEFYTLDISKDDLPPADCVILRQVLQHLSNAEIQRILNKIVSYKYIILTEHLPMGDFTPNKDIISGQGIRLKQKSGVDLLQPPFNFTPKTQQILNEITLDNQKERIVTTLYS